MSHSAGLPRLHLEVPSALHAARSVLVGARRVFDQLKRVHQRPAWHRAAPAPVRAPLQPEEIRFRRLRTPEDIACVLPLRGEINLPRAGDAGFAALEKKEMSAALSALSSGVDKSSAPSASFPWAAGSLPARTSSPERNCRRRCSRTAGK